MGQAAERKGFTPEEIGRIVLDFMQMEEFAKDPFIISKAQGVKYWDTEGREYWDGLSGVFVAGLGHGNRRVIEAIKAQLEEVSFIPPLHATNPKAIELANLVSRLAPGDLNTVKLLSGGSEAIEVGLKMARQYHRQTGSPTRFKNISLYRSYHGMTMGALSAMGLKRRKAVSEPLLNGFIHVPPPYCYRCPYGKEYPGCDITCARIIGEIIRNEGEELISSVLVEPILQAAGVLIPPREYHSLLRRICDETGALLIYDEVITGFGRIGELFAADFYGTVPDILCAGKGMSSGYAPLAAAIARDRVAQAFRGRGEEGVEFSHGHTYAANPVSSAAGLAAIGELLDRGLAERARVLGAHMRERLGELEALGHIGELRAIGMLACLELVKDPLTKEPFPEGVAIGHRVERAARRRGLVIRPDVHFVTIAPPLVATEEEVDEMVRLLGQSLKDAIREAA